MLSSKRSKRSKSSKTIKNYKRSNPSKRSKTSKKTKKIDKIDSIEKLFIDFYRKTPIIHKVLLTDQKKELKLGQTETYFYESFAKSDEILSNFFEDKLELYDNKTYNLYDKYRKEITEGYARGVAHYISKNIKMPYKVSNAFCKLWEIYSNDVDLLPLKHDPYVFFVAEAPGQWIYSSNHYYKTKYIAHLTYKSKETKKENINPHLEWRANSLNPNHPINIKQFGNMFGDNYGFIKQYPDNWLYGADNTGDILSVENQKWYQNFAKDFHKFDLITGDAGLGANNLELLQKIEYACVCMIASVASIGSNCIMKHFTPHNDRLQNANQSSGFFVNYLYLYYLLFDELKLIKPLTSNPNSGEFYVIGKGFRGISDENYNKLLNILGNFQANRCFFNKKDIPEEFVEAILSFNKQITELRYNHKELGIKVIKCMKFDAFRKENKDCKFYLDKNKIRNIQTKLFKNWIKTNRFE